MFKAAPLAAFLPLAFLSAASAQAADLGYAPLAPPMLQIAPCWTGFYAGLGGGITAFNSELHAQPGPALSGNPGAAGAFASFDGLGATGGFFELNAGADYQVNSWLVVGAFFDFDFENTRSEINVSVPGAPFEAHSKLNIDNKWSIGGRLGYLASPGTLLFVSGGFTQANMSNLNVSAGGPFPSVATAITVPSFSGGFVGAGAETKLTEHISIRGEYRWTDFGSGQLGLPTVNGINLNDFVSARASPTMQDWRVSLNYRF
jgi:outer membrane immunogenic protein